MLWVMSWNKEIIFLLPFSFETQRLHSLRTLSFPANLRIERPSHTDLIYMLNIKREYYSAKDWTESDQNFLVDDTNQLEIKKSFFLFYLESMM